MKKIIGLTILIATLHSAIAQTEKFDIVTFTPPVGWLRGIKEGAVTYSSSNTATGKFCVISLYNSKVSSGDALMDFKNEWKELVVPFNGSLDPVTEMQKGEDGWIAIGSASAVRQDSIQFYAVLTVFSGFGKKVSILTMLNDRVYLQQVDSVLKSIKLEIVKPGSDSSGTKREILQDDNSHSIVGVWSTTDMSITNYVNASGGYIGDATVSTMEEYSFKADNTYKYRFFGHSGGRIYYTETIGTFKITGRNLVLTHLKRKGGYNGVLHDEKNLLGKPETFDCYIGPNKWNAGPFLNLHKDGNYYPWSDYPYDYFNKVNVK